MTADRTEAKLREIGAGAERARSELDKLIGQVEALRSSLEPAGETPTPPGPVPDPGPGPPPTPDPDPAPTPPPVPEPTPPPVPEPTPPPVPEPRPPSEPEPTPPPEISVPGDDSAARLVAMKLAVDGRSREEIAAELDAKFGAADRAQVLDDVLARAGR